MKLLAELNEDIEPILEQSDNGGKKLYIRGVFMRSEFHNKNGRLYPRSVMESGVKKYMDEKVTGRTAYGELNHPAGPTINLDRVSHIIEDLHFEGNDVIGKARILDTPMGLTVQKILEGGGRIGVSSRALGSLKEQNGVMVVQPDFMISTAADIVADPSASAFPDAFMEDIEWYMESGIWKQRTIEAAKAIVENKGRKPSEQAVLECFQFLLNDFRKRH